MIQLFILLISNDCVINEERSYRCAVLWFASRVL